ncbi:hypothetical protein RUND412_005653 [Rhizina undulata]
MQVDDVHIVLGFTDLLETLTKGTNPIFSGCLALKPMPPEPLQILLPPANLPLKLLYRHSLPRNAATPNNSTNNPLNTKRFCFVDY